MATQRNKEHKMSEAAIQAAANLEQAAMRYSRAVASGHRLSIHRCRSYLRKTAIAFATCLEMER